MPQTARGLSRPQRAVLQLLARRFPEFVDRATLRELLGGGPGSLEEELGGLLQWRLIQPEEEADLFDPRPGGPFSRRFRITSDGVQALIDEEAPR